MRFLAVALTLLALPASAADIRVIDGDTFELNGETILLWGIDAVEGEQRCGPRGFPIGVVARAELVHILRDGAPTCRHRDTDRYGRTVAQCWDTQGRDIASVLVSRGMARDWPRYSGGHYGAEEQTAMARPVGMWAHDCMAPWEWRRR